MQRLLTTHESRKDILRRAEEMPYPGVLAMVRDLVADIETLASVIVQHDLCHDLHGKVVERLARIESENQRLRAALEHCRSIFKGEMAASAPGTGCRNILLEVEASLAEVRV